MQSYLKNSRLSLILLLNLFYSFVVIATPVYAIPPSAVNYREIVDIVFDWPGIFILTGDSILEYDPINTRITPYAIPGSGKPSPGGAVQRVQYLGYSGRDLYFLWDAQNMKFNMDSKIFIPLQGIGTPRLSKDEIQSFRAENLIRPWFQKKLFPEEERGNILDELSTLFQKEGKTLLEPTSTLISERQVWIGTTTQAQKPYQPPYLISFARDEKRFKTFPFTLSTGEIPEEELDPLFVDGDFLYLRYFHAVLKSPVWLIKFHMKKGSFEAIAPTTVLKRDKPGNLWIAYGEDLFRYNGTLIPKVQSQRPIL